ncbi:hypothetical protein AAY473_021466 [Plecturocebus cupreus]
MTFPELPRHSSYTFPCAWRGGRICHRSTSEGARPQSHSGTVCASYCDAFQMMTFPSSSRFCGRDQRDS